MPYTYPFPRPMVTVDIMILQIIDNRLKILLIQRGHPPYQGKWAMPGGFVDMDERLRDAALRELAEETGISGIPLGQLGIFDDPQRDPRGRTISVAYGGVVPVSKKIKQATAGDDAANADWFDIEQLPPLAFDHATMIPACLERFRLNAILRGWLLLLVPEEGLPLDKFTEFASILLKRTITSDFVKTWLDFLPFDNPIIQGTVQLTIEKEALLNLSDAAISEKITNFLM